MCATRPVWYPVSSARSPGSCGTETGWSGDSITGHRRQRPPIGPAARARPASWVDIGPSLTCGEIPADLTFRTDMSHAGGEVATGRGGDAVPLAGGEVAVSWQSEPTSLAGRESPHALCAETARG
jgi:hypothetical protein